MLSALQLQPRDYALLCGLFESRVMTGGHVAALYFDGKNEYAKKRLQKLKKARFIGERRRNVNKPAVLFLTRIGFNALKEQGLLSAYPPTSANSFESRVNVSERTLRHELEVMDVKAAMHSAVSKSEKHSILKFSTWPLLHQFDVSLPGRDAPIKPDGFLSIHEKEDGTKGFYHDHYIELDRSSESQDFLVGKAVAYLEYYRSGDFAVRSGGTRADFKDFPFRVLMVLKTAERRNNTAERLITNNPPILRHTWLTTFAEVTANPLGPIWVKPEDYRAMTQGTGFYPKERVRRFEYHRQTEREMFIEGAITKHPLLG